MVVGVYEVIDYVMLLLVCIGMYMLLFSGMVLGIVYVLCFSIRCLVLCGRW